MSDTVIIQRRFCGPADSSNGGYCCGRLAACLEGPATVRLLAPPPLERPLRVERGDEVVELLDGDQRVATARPGGPQWEPPPGPAREDAEAAAKRYRGFSEHFYPSCFVCGPERESGDGLRIFAGPMVSSLGVAAPWTPGADLDDGQGRVAAEFIWAALDCPGAYCFEPSPGQAILLGELSGRLARPVAVGEDCVVMGWSMESEGRKHRVGTAVYGADGGARAWAEAVWIEVPMPDSD